MYKHHSPLLDQNMTFPTYFLDGDIYRDSAASSLSSDQSVSVKIEHLQVPLVRSIPAQSTFKHEINYIIKLKTFLHFVDILSAICNPSKSDMKALQSPGHVYDLNIQTYEAFTTPDLILDTMQFQIHKTNVSCGL